ncbi:MAG: glutathione S-transferase family protein [Pseudomonadota bacterium]
MIIYGSTLSPFVRKVVAICVEKDLPFTLEFGTLGNHSPGFIAASPLKKMPAIDDNGFMLADSSAIAHYLDAQYPAPQLIPSDPQLRGKAIWYDEFADTVLMVCGGKMFFNRIVAPRFMGREGDEAAAAAAECEELPPLLAYLEGLVPDPGGYLVGDSLTIADISVASVFVNFRHAARALDESRFPRTFAYVDSILDRPSFAESVRREQAMLAPAA